MCIRDRRSSRASTCGRAAQSSWRRRPPALAEPRGRTCEGGRGRCVARSLWYQSRSYSIKVRYKEPDSAPQNICTKRPGRMCSRIDSEMSVRSTSSNALINQSRSAAFTASCRRTANSSAIEHAQCLQLSFHGPHAPDRTFPCHGILLYFPSVISLTWDTTSQEFIESHTVLACQC